MITFLSHQTLVSSQCPHRSNTFEGNIYIHVAAVSIHRLDHPPDCYFTHLQVLPWQWLLVRLHCSLLHMRYMYSKSVLSLFSAMGFFGASYPQQSIDHRIASGKMMKKIPRRGNNRLIVTNATIRRIITNQYWCDETNRTAYSTTKPDAAASGETSFHSIVFIGVNDYNSST